MFLLILSPGPPSFSILHAEKWECNYEKLRRQIELQILAKLPTIISRSRFDWRG